MLKPLVLVTCLAAGAQVAAGQQFVGEVRRADQKPMSGVQVALIEDPTSRESPQRSANHDYAVTDGRGRCVVRVRGPRIGGHLVLAALGCVSQRRVSIEHRITREPNIIVVPLNFRPCARPKSPNASNHAMERTATRRAFSFRVAWTLSLRVTLAPGGRRSSFSR
jgi:hypothetical protein